jgi:uncharacterized protein YecT (DUF1311 family)
VRAVGFFGLAFGVALAVSAHASAASFDCAKAVTAREQLICGDPKLAAADEALAASYRAALRPLSPAAQRALRAGQQSWLHFVDTICRTGGRQIPPAANRFDTPTSCIEGRYAVRQRQLDHATTVSDGLVIGRFEDFAATPSDDSNRFLARNVAYPQIDRPRSKAQQRWNAAMRNAAARLAEKPNPENPNTDVWVDYRLVTVTPALISLLWSVSWYGHGAAHPNNNELPVNWLMAPSRRVAADDLFDPAKPWREGLAELCFAALISAKEATDNPYFVKSAAALRDIADRADRWIIERDGLGIQFQPYEIGPYVMGAPRCVVTWDKLRPFVAEHPMIVVPSR